MGALISAIKLNGAICCVLTLLLPLYLVTAVIITKIIKLAYDVLIKMPKYKQYVDMAFPLSRNEDNFKLIHVLLVSLLLALLSIFMMMVLNYTSEAAFRRDVLITEMRKQHKRKAQ